MKAPPSSRSQRPQDGRYGRQGENEHASEPEITRSHLSGRLLPGLGREVFAGFRRPQSQEPRFWSEAAEALDRDPGTAGLGPPKLVHEIALARAREIFDRLPVHENLRQHDFTIFRATLRFHMAEIGTEFSERGDMEALAGTLVH